MSEFNLYAKYYDLLYQDKDYQSEVDYIDALIKKFSLTSANSILDLGCGTGKHANLFSKIGYTIDGVDLSLNMISLAKENYINNKALDFFNENVTKFRNDKVYDIVTSLFHVVSYQNTNAEIIDTFKTAFNHLDVNGLFVFDFWYGPGVLTHRPEKRTKALENEWIGVKRNAFPVLHVNENIVDVNYEINIIDKCNNVNETISEKHSMRYLFYQELKFYLNTVGFNIEAFYNWKTLDKPDTNSWNAVIVAKKK